MIPVNVTWVYQVYLNIEHLSFMCGCSRECALITLLARLWPNNNRQWCDYTTSPRLITPTTIYLLSTTIHFNESDTHLMQ